MDKKKIIAFQGRPGAYSDLACRAVYKDWETLPCTTFEDAFAAVQSGAAQLAMMPIENSTVGRVADIHHLLPGGDLHIIGEHYQPIEHQLLGVKGAKLSDIKEVHSHVQALQQCRNFLRKNGLKAVIRSDTAGSAAELQGTQDKSVAAIASKLAGEIYGLDILAPNIADQEGNTTRFLIMTKEAKMPKAGSGPLITSFIFRVRSVPAALYKALGGFASNGVNITKIESYMVDNKFTAAQFYADVEGHPEDQALRHAFEELSFFASEVKILGTYPAHPFRNKP
jgi:prephenate dehydratase